MKINLGGPVHFVGMDTDGFKHIADWKYWSWNCAQFPTGARYLST